MATERLRKSKRWTLVQQQAFQRDSQKIIRNPDGTTEVGARCWICGGKIDYSLQYPDRWAWEPDHFIPLNVDPSLAYDITNLRPAHAHCNRSRGDGSRMPASDLGLGKPSRRW